MRTRRLIPVLAALLAFMAALGQPAQAQRPLICIFFGFNPELLAVDPYDGRAYVVPENPHGISPAVIPESGKFIAWGMEFPYNAYGFGSDMEECLGGVIADGRLNGRDIAAPVAIYRSSQGYEIYGISPTDGEGSLLFVVTPAEIAAALSGASGNVLVEAEGAVGFYVLEDGSFVVSAPDWEGNPYSFTWK